MFSTNNYSDDQASERNILEFDADLYEIEVDFGVAQVKEVNGKWRDLRIFRSKENRDDVVLFFGKSEYEGLYGGYRYESHGGKMMLTDPDGDVIEIKSIRKKQKHTKNAKSTSEMKDKKNGFQQGDRVEAKWQKGQQYYMARIARVHDDGESFDLVYDDGFVEKALSRKFLRRPESAKKAIVSEQAVGINSLCHSSEPKTQAKLLPTSKYRGLTWDPEREKWKVSVSVDNRVDVIGFYQTERYAAHIYEKAIQRLNKPDARKQTEIPHHDKQKSSGSSKQKQNQKQTSPRKSTVNFNKMEYRTEKTFADNVQVKEDDGRWAGVEIYRSKRNPADVVLFFGGEEYEGLAGGYRYSKGPDNRMVLTDGDGMVIETRIAGFKSKKRKKTTEGNKKQARMRPSNKYFGVYKNVDKGTWAAKVCHGRGRTSVIKCLTEKAAASTYDRHLGQAVNVKNVSIKPRPPASGLHGVSWDADSLRWRAVIVDGGHTRMIGLFRSEREAAEAYDREARQLTTITELNFEPETTSGADIGTTSASYEVVSDPALARALAVAVSQFRRHQQLPTHRDPLQGKFLNRLSRKYHVDSMVLLDRLQKFIA